MMHSAAHPGMSRVAGTGIFALREIPLGTAVWGPCGNCHIWRLEDLERIDSGISSWIEEYGYSLMNESVVVPCGGAHLINHSCEASVLDAGLTAGIAVRDIHVGEEITCDYRSFVYDKPWRFSCQCGSKSCCGTVKPIQLSSVESLTTDWHRRMQRAIESSRFVVQEIRFREGSIFSPSKFTWGSG